MNHSKTPPPPSVRKGVLAAAATPGRIRGVPNTSMVIDSLHPPRYKRNTSLNTVPNSECRGALGRGGAQNGRMVRFLAKVRQRGPNPTCRCPSRPPKRWRVGAGDVDVDGGFDLEQEPLDRSGRCSQRLHGPAPEIRRVGEAQWRVIPVDDQPRNRRRFRVVVDVMQPGTPETYPSIQSCGPARRRNRSMMDPVIRISPGLFTSSKLRSA